MKDIFLFYFFSSLLPQLSNSYSRKPKDKKTLALGMTNNFSVVWIENESNFKHFHIPAMSNNRITANYEFFVKILTVVTATRPSHHSASAIF